MSEIFDCYMTLDGKSESVFDHSRIFSLDFFLKKFSTTNQPLHTVLLIIENKAIDIIYQLHEFYNLLLQFDLGNNFFLSCISNKSHFHPN